MNGTIKTRSRGLKRLAMCLAGGIFLFAGAGIFLYWHSAVNFPQKMYAQSRQHISVQLAVGQIRSALKIHERALAEYARYGGDKWLDVLQKAQKKIQEELAFLGQINKEAFKLADSSLASRQENVRAALDRFVENSDEQIDPARDLPVLHGLLVQNFNYNFRWIQVPDVQASTDPAGRTPERGLSGDALRESGLFKGLNRLKHMYGVFFWSEQSRLNSRSFQQTRFYFFTLLSAGAVVALLSLFVLKGLLRANRLLLLENVSLGELQMRDGVTGLLNSRGFEHIVQHELERARRHGEHAAFVALRLEPFREIMADWGGDAATELIKSVAQAIHRCFRAYDNVFRVDEHTFVAMLSQANISAVPSFLARLKTALYQKHFPLSNRHATIMPKIRVGVSIYPSEGQTAQDLLQSALSQLSETFEVVNRQADRPQGAEIQINQKPAAVEQGGHEYSGTQAAANDNNDDVRVEKPDTQQELLSHSGLVVPETFTESFPDEPDSQTNSDTAELPDLIYALNQEWVAARQTDQRTRPAVAKQVLQASTEMDLQEKSVSQNRDSSLRMKVLQSESEEVIMVDFDGEKYDPAQNFRKKIKQQTRQKV